MEKRFDRVYNMLSFLSMYFMASAFIVPAFGSLGSFVFSFVGAAFVLAFMLAGYFLQAFFCAATKFERRGNYSTYESTVKYFNLGRATPVISLALLTVFVGSGVFRNIYTELAHKNHNILYDPNSLVPYVIAVVIAFLLVFGSVIWFYPYRRFALLRVPMTCLPMLLVSFFFSTQFGAGGGTVSAVCLLGYSVCALILINQSSLTGCCKGFDSVSFLTGKSRAYNALMTLSLLLLLAAVASVLFIALAGLAIIGRFLLVIFFLATNRPDDPYEASQYNFSYFVLGETAKERAANSTVFTVFIAAFAFVVFVLIVRKSTLFKDILTSVKKWIAELFEFLFAFADKKNKKESEDEGFRSYKDEERRRQKAKISPYSMKIASTKSYKDFLAKLGEFKSSREKLGFAYATLVSRVIGAQKFVRLSDTPREIASKLERDPLYDGINGITEAFEVAAYSSREISAEKSEAALKTLCNIIRKHLD